MERRKFSREFKLEAIKLVKERGVSFAQVGRDLECRRRAPRHASGGRLCRREDAASCL